MNPLQAAMFDVAARCDELGLAYFVTGSVASMAWGESRHTLDVDMVIDLPSHMAGRFCESFTPPRWYVSTEAAIEASTKGGQFNLILPLDGVKVDVVILSETEFNRSRVARAREIDFDGRRIRFASPEDVILKKLEYFQQGGSDKHLRDVTGILKISGSQVDLGYIEHWASQLSVHEEWMLIKRRLGM